jgi:CheY-like chemotaxis protein
MANILLVDDDAEVLSTLAAIVSVGGHDVVQAHNAAEALAVLRSDRPLDLLLTDIVMPDVSGFHLARMARNRRPDLRVLYLCGCWDSPDIAGEYRRYGDLIKKPILPIDLRKEIASTLAAVPRA